MKDYLSIPSCFSWRKNRAPIFSGFSQNKSLTLNSPFLFLLKPIDFMHFFVMAKATFLLIVITFSVNANFPHFQCPFKYLHHGLNFTYSQNKPGKNSDISAHGHPEQDESNDQQKWQSGSAYFSEESFRYGSHKRQTPTGGVVRPITRFITMIIAN